MDKAIDLLREKGLAASVKKAGRIAAEGVAYAAVSDCGKVAVVVEVNAETDFVAKNAEFQAFVKICADTIIHQNPADVETLLQCKAEGSELTVDALARQVYTSKYHFMRRFKELTGCPVHQYITQKRLLAAAGLLRAGVSAQEACGQCGFQDYSAFHRAFRRQFGATPREFMP